MGAHSRNLRVEQTADFRKAFWLRRDCSASTPVELTGWQAKSQWRPKLASPTVLVELTTENGGITIDAATGQLTHILTPQQREALMATHYSRLVYDTFITSPAGKSYKLLMGEVLLVRSVTRNA